MDIEGATTARPVAGTLELFPDAGDVAMRYRLNGSEDDGDCSRSCWHQASTPPEPPPALVRPDHLGHRGRRHRWSPPHHPTGNAETWQLHPWRRVHPRQACCRRSTLFDLLHEKRAARHDARLGVEGCEARFRRLGSRTAERSFGARPRWGVTGSITRYEPHERSDPAGGGGIVNGRTLLNAVRRHVPRRPWLNSGRSPWGPGRGDPV